MNKVVIASIRQSAGKTSAIVGIAAALNKKIMYLKPFGDRMVSQKKRLWDYDAALITGLFGVNGNPVDMSLAFEHSKIQYRHDEEGTKQRVLEHISRIRGDQEILFIEGGNDLSYGISVHLDSVSLAKHTGGRLFIVISGEEGSLLDDLVFLKTHVNLTGVTLGGIIINKVQNLYELSIHLPMINSLFRVVGVIPYQRELTYCSVHYLAERLGAKVIAGEGGLKRVVKNVIVGAWSANVLQQNPLFEKENKLVITGGDRSDMILACLEGDTSGIILTNNILPISKVISKAEEHKIPLLVVPADTYQSARQIERLEMLMTREDHDKLNLLKQLFTKYVNLDEFLKS